MVVDAPGTRRRAFAMQARLCERASDSEDARRVQFDPLARPDFRAALRTGGKPGRHHASPSTDQAPSQCRQLTPREVEVLRLLADGLDGTEIARALGICPGTVRTHVEHMRHSLDCRTRAGLVAKGYRLHYLD